MKKNFPILVLLLTAAFVFSGCDKKMPTLVPDEFQPLFDPDDAYVDTNALDLSDGKWIYRCLSLIDNKINTEQLEFTVKDKVIDKTKDYTYKKGILKRPKGSSEIALATFIAKGLEDSDNNYTLDTTTKEEYETELAKFSNGEVPSTSSCYFEYLIIKRFSNPAFVPLGYRKKNPKGTKIFYTVSEYDGTDTPLQNYLMKDD